MLYKLEWMSWNFEIMVVLEENKWKKVDVVEDLQWTEEIIRQENKDKMQQIL